MSVLKTFGSIRTRLLALLLLLVAGSFGLISHKIYNDSVHEVRELFDAQLSQTARLLMGLVRHDLSDSERREMQAVLDEALLLHTRATRTTCWATSPTAHREAETAKAHRG